MNPYLRAATPDDMELIYRWANDASVRANSFSTKEISPEEHQKWYSNMLQRTDVFLYIMSDQGTDIGQIRINISGKQARISYSIASAHRGKGYGKEMVRLLIRTIQKDFPHIERLTAEVKPGNAASCKVFESLGFEQNLEQMHVTYELNL